MSSKIFAVRMAAAVAAVLGFSLYRWLNLEPFKWAGLMFYLICLAMYAKALFMALTRTRKVTADLLVVTVMVVSLMAGDPLSGALVAWFISMGLAVSFAVIEKTRRKIESLTREKGKNIRVMRDDIFRELPVEQLRRGDKVIVPVGEMIPVDGEILEGASSVDESVLTGEPYPVFKKKGDQVTSGAIALTSQLQIRADKAGDKGFLCVMGREIEASLMQKPRIHQKADAIAQFFICGVVLYAVGVFLITGGLTGDTAAGLLRMAAVTAVACPCAWALSVPTAFAAAIGGLSGRGILVRGGIPLETAGRAENVVLDKTGTVTLRKPIAAGIQSFGLPEMELLGFAASVESGFNHPAAAAILSYASSKGVQTLPAENAEYLPGIGVKAIVQGREVILGNTETIAALGMEIPPDIKIEGRAVWIAIDRAIAGMIDVRDELTDSAVGLADALHRLGVKNVVLATGDSEESEARRVAERISADRFYRGLKPGDKVNLVNELRKQGVTIMIGDGVNDAASLAASDVGISIGRDKADLAVKSSDIIIMKNSAESLLTVIQTGRRLMQVIKLNYAWAVGFNLTGIVLATAGMLSPWLAALVHHLSSVLVVANSARLVRVSGGKD